jgi:hypothetical protein
LPTGAPFAPLVAAGDHDARALLRESARGREPDAAAAAGHQRDLVAHLGIARHGEAFRAQSFGTKAPGGGIFGST